MELAILIIVAITCGLISFYFLYVIINRFWGEKIIKFLNNLKFKKNTTKLNSGEMLTFIGNLTSTLARLSTDKVGALIVLQNRDSLNKYIEVGNKVDAAFFPELIYTVFYNHQSPLHDGAIILKNLRIASISSYLPISKRILDVKFGARHRAAFGITEATDATAFVVSETTGKISCMYMDNLYSLSSIPTKLADEIIKIFSVVGIIIDKNNTTTVSDIDASTRSMTEDEVKV